MLEIMKLRSLSAYLAFLEVFLELGGFGALSFDQQQSTVKTGNVFRVFGNNFSLIPEPQK